MSKVAIVTGANQGLGLALVRGLCRTLGTEGIVYLTARDRKRGEQAVGDLEAEGLSPRLELLDVRDGTSVKALAHPIAERHGRVDILISNAAARIFPQVPSGQQVRTFVDTNNHGTLRVIKGFVPPLNDGARFIVVASSFGTLASLDPRTPRQSAVHSATSAGSKWPPTRGPRGLRAAAQWAARSSTLMTTLPGAPRAGWARNASGRAASSKTAETTGRSCWPSMRSASTRNCPASGLTTKYVPRTSSRPPLPSAGGSAMATRVAPLRSTCQERAVVSPPTGRPRRRRHGPDPRSGRCSRGRRLRRARRRRRDRGLMRPRSPGRRAARRAGRRRRRRRRRRRVPARADRAAAPRARAVPAMR